MSQVPNHAGEFRKMSRSDLPRVLEIELRSYRTPWDEGRFLQALNSKSGCQCVVYESTGVAPSDSGREAPDARPSSEESLVTARVAPPWNGKTGILAYFVLELHATSTHIINLAVHPAYRRHGLASRCLALIDQLATRAMEIAKARDPAALQPLVRPGMTQASRAGGPGHVSRGARAVETAPKAAPQGDSRRADGDSHEGQIYLEVEEGNLPAQLLYRKMGFRAVKILRNYYPLVHEDGYKMVRQIPFPSANALAR